MRHARNGNGHRQRRLENLLDRPLRAGVPKNAVVDIGAASAKSKARQTAYLLPTVLRMSAERRCLALSNTTLRRGSTNCAGPPPGGNVRARAFYYRKECHHVLMPYGVGIIGHQWNGIHVAVRIPVSGRWALVYAEFLVLPCSASRPQSPESA